MSYKNRFYKNTFGVDAEFLVAKAVEYTDDSTLEAFVANAVEGEVAVVKFTDNTIYTAAIPLGDKFFIALKRDGNVEKTAPITAVSAGLLQKIAYVAPVKHVVTVTTNAARAAVTIQNLIYTADAYGVGGNDISITYTSGGTAGSEVVTVSGNAISVKISSGTSTATQIKTAVDANADASALISVATTGTASTAQTAVAATFLAGGVSLPTPEKGDLYEITVVETTPLLEPLPRWSYSVEARAGESYTSVVDRLVTKINSTTSPENQNKTLIVTASRSTYNVVLTAIDYNVHFTAAIRGDFEDYTVVNTTPFKIGRGTYQQAKEAEFEGDVRRGQNTQYPIQNATDAEFSPRTSFADAEGANAQFVTYQITYTADYKTTANAKEFRKNNVFVFVSDGTADPISEFDTIFANID